MATSTMTTLPTPPPSFYGFESSLDLRETSLSISPFEHLHGVGVSDASRPAKPERVRYERKMGDSELSYYLPSRANGVNDMYLHLGFRAPKALAERARVRAVWAIMRARHPLLAAGVEMEDGAYDDVRFVYTPHLSAEDALTDADENLEYRTQTKDELIDTYLNGPRTLSNTRISYLILSQPSSQILPSPPVTPSLASFPDDNTSSSSSSTEKKVKEGEYDLLICAAHFLGDGMALHQFAHDFFELLGSEQSQGELEGKLKMEWKSKWGPDAFSRIDVLPRNLEGYLPVKGGRLRGAVAKVDFQKSQEKLIGGQSFARVPGKPRHTIVPTVSFSEERTKKMLKKCKEHGVSISAALFALCNVVWARMVEGEKMKRELPMMMYSALNLRPYFHFPAQSEPPSYWFLAVGYFNVILPTFLPTSSSDDAVSPHEKTFWYRARLAKEQCAVAAKNKMVVERTQEMAKERGARARVWAGEDDEKERREKEKAAGMGILTPSPSVTVAPIAPTPPAPTSEPQPQSKSTSAPKPPSQALLGLSLLGNLDGIYKHPTFPSIKMHTLTTGSRQRQGGMLLFGYTFAGKLWISLGYDELGFGKEAGVFWESVVRGVEEFLG